MIYFQEQQFRDHTLQHSQHKRYRIIIYHAYILPIIDRDHTIVVRYPIRKVIVPIDIEFGIPIYNLYEASLVASEVSTMVPSSI